MSLAIIHNHKNLASLKVIDLTTLLIHVLKVSDAIYVGIGVVFAASWKISDAFEISRIAKLTYY